MSYDGPFREGKRPSFYSWYHCARACATPALPWLSLVQQQRSPSFVEACDASFCYGCGPTRKPMRWPPSKLTIALHLRYHLPS